MNLSVTIQTSAKVA